MSSAAAGEASGDRLPSLNSPNLRKLDFVSDGDRDQLLRQFVRSQKAFLSSYALDGQQVTASWEHQDAVSIPTRRALKDFELESGFGTPLLKPRASARVTPKDDAYPVKSTKKTTKDIHVVSSDGESPSKGRKASRKTGKDATYIQRRVDAPSTHTRYPALDPSKQARRSPSLAKRSTAPDKRKDRKALRVSHTRDERDRATDEERRNSEPTNSHRFIITL